MKGSGGNNGRDEPKNLKDVGEYKSSENGCSQLLRAEWRVSQEKMISDGIISEQEQF